MNYGFIRVAAAVLRLKVADCLFNAANIIDIIKRADKLGIQFIVFPELSITAYTCGDLFHQQTLLNDALEQLNNVLRSTRGTEIVAVAGIPLIADNRLYNCGVAFQRGRILGVVPKTYITSNKGFDENRWFSSGSGVLSDSIKFCGQQVPFGTDLLFEAEEDKRICFGIEICEDLWSPLPPSSYQAISGAVLLFNLSADVEIVGKNERRRNMIEQQSEKCKACYVYASCGIDESTTDFVFGGHAIIAENGHIIASNNRFLREDQLVYTEVDIEKILNDKIKNTSFNENTGDKKYRKIQFGLKQIEITSLKKNITPYPFVPSDPDSRDERCSEIFSIQTAGLAKRLEYTGIKQAVIGISGGLDSTLALMVTVKTFDLLGISRENIIGVTMPGFGTTNETYKNALGLMKSMGVTIKEINIKDACLQHFKDIGHDIDKHDVAYENVQARERTQILMDLANKLKGLVIGTGDLSELALGWCTYNGDHMSMYAVNNGVPKTLMKHMVRWAADNMAESGTRDVLYKILDTPITPELLPPGINGEIKQKTEDIIGPYELHDFFLYHMIRYGASPLKILFLAEQAFKEKYLKEEIKKWLRVFCKRFFRQQFKRSCLPDGPKVGTVNLSPRGSWCMPSDAEAGAWLRELE